MKISNIVSITSCVNAIPLHIFTSICRPTIRVDDYEWFITDNPNYTVANSALPPVDATVEDETVTPTTNTPAYYEFTTTTHDFDHSTESEWSTSIPAHQNLYGVDAPLPPYRPNEKTLKQKAAKAKAQEETFTTESTPNSFSQCNIL